MGAVVQIPDDIRQCVAFIYFDNKKTGTVELAGTGFFVSVPWKRPSGDLLHPYFVTAHHVIAGIQSHGESERVLIRLNRPAERAGLSISTLSDWVRHPTDTAVDVAVLPWGLDEVVASKIDIRFIPVSMALDSGAILQHRVGPGDDVFVAGLFVHHPGRERNIPIVRVGTLAAMNDEEICDGSPYAPLDGYLIEARSTGGLSGSPVFLHLGYTRWIDLQVKTLQVENPLYLLGLIHAHWDESNQEAGPINMGIAIVVPAQRIIDVINQEELATKRQAVEDEFWNDSQAE